MLSGDLLASRLLSHYGYASSAAPECLLRNLLLAFCRIPYENLTKIIRAHDSQGARYKESPVEVIDYHIKHGTGGTCFALTDTLVYLLRELRYEAHPILADRRYGVDTHCAVIAKLSSQGWDLIDPGYMIFTPCPLPQSGTARYELSLSTIELRVEEPPERVSLYTLQMDSSGERTTRHRLTYKTAPVDQSEFAKAWDRSFDWEMMSYPIISAVAADSHLYIQKNSLLVRSPSTSSRITLPKEELAQEIASRLRLSPDVVKRAFAIVE